MRSLSFRSGDGRERFRRIVSCFLSQSGLPFADVLSSERIEQVFARHGNLFGRGQVYTTVVTLWSFLGQVLRDGKEASCQSAVAHVVTWCSQCGELPPTSDTGDYCRARNKLSEAALHELTSEIADEHNLTSNRPAPAVWVYVESLLVRILSRTVLKVPVTAEPTTFKHDI